MPTVELIYDDACPNVAEARAQMLRAFARTAMRPHWTEWLATAADTPTHARGYGSPTILVNGQDVAGAPRADADCCRLYEHSGGEMRGVPSVDMIAAALQSDGGVSQVSSNRERLWKLNIAMIPGVGAALLPKVACPACWPAYAGFLSSIGFGFLLTTTYLLPLTATFLAMAVGALAFRAKKRRGYLPFLVGTIAATVVLVGKFTFESDPAMYAGLTLLVGASLWNTWPYQRATSTCPDCPDTDHKPKT